MLRLEKSDRVLFVVAHPDDEVLGVGGTINKLVHEYETTVRVIILGEGITSRDNVRDVEKRRNDLLTHKSNIDSARKILGYESTGIYDFPDNRFDTVPLLDIVKVVEKEKELFKPNFIFTHHGGDLNIDHQLTFDAVFTACRPMEKEIVKTIITFETPSGTEWRASSDPKHFIPNFYHTISEKNLNAKIEAMESYEFESRKYPHPRSPEALRVKAKMSGVNVGKEFAEALHIVRTIS